MLATAVVAMRRPITADASATSTAPHTFLHLNCPPGSHGPARSEGVGRSLMDAREQSRSTRL